MSLFGWGTVTRPSFVGCVNCQWLLFVATCVQPSSRSMRINLPLLRSTIYSLLCINIHNAASLSTGHTISLLLGPQTAGAPIDPRRRYGAGRERRHGAFDASGRAGDGPFELRRARRREGRYLLRSNLTGEDPATLWRYYMQLTESEQAFKELKHDLAIRPIFHQREDRIEAHIFLAFIAYCLYVTLKHLARPLSLFSKEQTK